MEEIAQRLFDALHTSEQGSIMALASAMSDYKLRNAYSLKHAKPGFKKLWNAMEEAIELAAEQG